MTHAEVLQSICANDQAFDRKNTVVIYRSQDLMKDKFQNSAPKNLKEFLGGVNACYLVVHSPYADSVGPQARSLGNVPTLMGMSFKERNSPDWQYAIFDR